MLVFHELVYEGYVLAGSAILVSTGPHFMPLLGAVDALHVSGYTAQVTGTSPTLTITIDVSNDRIFWWPQNIFGTISNLALSTSGETLFQGVDGSPTAQRFGYAKVNIALGGDNARGFVRVWATGRDRSRRSAANAPSVNGMAANGGHAPMGMARPMPKTSNRMGLHGPKA